MSEYIQFPPQQLPLSKKTKKWRKQILDWGSNNATMSNSLIRSTTYHKKINYDLVNGIIHMKDIELILNPDSVKAEYIPEKIQHYPIINSKLNVLRGEEVKRLFDYRIVITNPNSISEIEQNKKNALFQMIQEEIANQSESDEDFNNNIQKIGEYFNFEWKDIRELRANCLLNHYSKELNFDFIFNQGFMDALTIAEEMYMCDIVGGEPTLERINPRKVRAFKSGYSNRIEDADVIVIEDYWSPGRIVDTYYDVLTPKDREYIEHLPDTYSEGFIDKSDNVDPRGEFISIDDGVAGDAIFSSENFWNSLTEDSTFNNKMPYDRDGNIRVLRMFWKSRRKIKKIKYYDENGETQYKLRDETYITNDALGEEEQVYYINEAWEGTKIGEDIYVNMRPRVVQYNRLSNPSKCHFGIIGSIYNLNESKPFSLVDMMKPYSYLYDVIHERLNRLIARNWGVLINVDLAQVPTGWDMNKWLHYAKIEGIAVKDSFKEGNVGAATGKLAGALNNASSGVINAELGNSIQQYINLLEFIKLEMSEVCGVTRQREGQISNRETVGGVERSTLQSSYITEWLYTTHEDVKKRVLECFLETAKIALKGRNKKFQYLLSDGSSKVMDIDGDEFAECDYGLTVDTSNAAQELNQKLDVLAQAALQNQALNFSTIMKLYNSCSLAEKQRMVEKCEQDMMQRQQEAQQQQQQMQQQQMEMQAQQKQAEMQLEDSINQRDNETKILIANINAESKSINSEQEYSEKDKEALLEKIREFDERLKLDREKLALDKDKARMDNNIKRQSLNKKK